MKDRNYVDISFTVLARNLQGRRLLRDLDTGQTFYDPEEPVVPEGHFDGPPNLPLGPVEPLPEASVEQPSADPAPPIKPARKPRKKNG